MDHIALRVKNNSEGNQQQQRPHSMAVDDFQRQHKNNMFIKPDQLQKELVQAKIEEMKRIKSGERKKRKSDNEINRVGRPGSPPRRLGGGGKDEYGFKSGYNTWNNHDATTMREKSKQFFMNDSASNNTHQQQQQQQQDTTRSSTRSSNLQRQSSLPPRTKKESIEIQRVLPRAPSGPMYKSPEQKPRALTKNSDTPSSLGVYHVRSTSTPSSRTSTPQKTGGAGVAVKQTNSANPLSAVAINRLKRPDEADKRYSSIMDITRSGGSVKISHKAEI